MDDPFSFDVWRNSPPKATGPEPNVEQMAQAMLSRLNSTPGAGLPANYNSHVFRVIQSHNDLQHTIDDLKRKLEEADVNNKHLRMQLNALGPGRRRAESGASKVSLESLRERLEQREKDLLMQQPSKSEMSPASGVSPVKSFRRPATISPKPSFGSAESLMFPSVPSLQLSHDEHTSKMSQSKADGGVSSSVHSNLPSGDILSNMYHLAGLMVGKRNISFHQAFYRIFKAFYGDSNLIKAGKSELHQTSSNEEEDLDNLPPLSELLEEACRLESGKATPKPKTNPELPTLALPAPSPLGGEQMNRTASDAGNRTKSGKEISHSAHSDSSDSTSFGSIEQARLTRSVGDLDRADGVNSDQKHTPHKRHGNLSARGSPVRSPLVAKFYFPFEWRPNSSKKSHIKQTSDASDASANTIIHRSPSH